MDEIPSPDIQRQIDGLVGTQELELRRQMGDVRYEAVLAMNDATAKAATRLLDARARLREAVASAISLVLVAGVGFGVAWTIWAMH